MLIAFFHVSRNPPTQDSIRGRARLLSFLLRLAPIPSQFLSSQVPGQDLTKAFPFAHRLRDLLLRLRLVRPMTLLEQEIGQGRKGRSLGMNPLIILHLPLYQEGRL